MVCVFLVYYYCGGTLTTNRQPLAFSVVSPLGLLVNNSKFDRTASLSEMYFSVSFGGSIVTIQERMFPSRCLGLSGSSSVLLCVHTLRWHAYYIYTVYTYTKFMFVGYFFISEPCCLVGAKQIHEVIHGH